MSRRHVYETAPRVVHSRRLSFKLEPDQLTVFLNFPDPLGEHGCSRASVRLDAHQASFFAGGLLRLLGYDVGDEPHETSTLALNVYRVRHANGDVDVRWSFFQQGKGLVLTAREDLSLEDAERVALVLAGEYGWEVER